VGIVDNFINEQTLTLWILPFAFMLGGLTIVIGNKSPRTSTILYIGGTIFRRFAHKVTWIIIGLGSGIFCINSLQEMSNVEPLQITRAPLFKTISAIREPLFVNYMFEIATAQTSRQIIYGRPEMLLHTSAYAPEGILTARDEIRAMSGIDVYNPTDPSVKFIMDSKNLGQKRQRYAATMAEYYNNLLMASPLVWQQIGGELGFRHVLWRTSIEKNSNAASIQILQLPEIGRMIVSADHHHWLYTYHYIPDST